MSMKKFNLRFSLSPLKNLVTQFYFFNSVHLAYLRHLRTLVVTAFFAGTLSFSALAQSAQLPGSCQAFFTGQSKELEKLFIQNRDTQNPSDILRSMDALIQNGEANPNEAFMWASSEKTILVHLKDNYELDSTAIIEYAFMKKSVSKVEIENLIQILPISSPSVVEKSEYVNQVFVQALINRNVEIANYLIRNHEANMNTALLEIALRGDVETATYLVENYDGNILYLAPDSYAKTHLTEFLKATKLSIYQLSPLNIASSLGHKAFVEYLLKSGQRFFAERADAAFLIALKKGHKETAKVFIELNALKDPLKTLGTAIEIAKQSSDPQIADFLIQEITQRLDKESLEHPQVIAKEGLVKSSFYLATEKGLTEKVKLFIEQTEITVIDINNGITIALENGHKDLAVFMIQQLKNPYPNGLKIALSKGYRDIVQIYLFEKDFDINSLHDSSVKSLIELASRGELDILKDVFKAGYKNTKFLNTALPEVVSKSKLEEKELVQMIEFLISEGSNIEGQNLSGDTALHVVASQGKSLLTDKLIEHKANTNARNNNKETPLHLAVTGGELNLYIRAKGNPKVVQSLINNGSDLAAIDSYGFTPLERTKSPGASRRPGVSLYDSSNILVVLLKTEGNLEFENYMNDSTPLEYATEKENLELVADLVELGANVHSRYLNIVDRMKQQMNNWANHNGSLDILQRALFRYDFHLRRSNSAQWEIENAEKIANILLTKADPKFRDEYGVSELMLVAEYGNVRQLKDLINKGHDINAKDKEGRSVIDYARFNKDTALLKFLQEKREKNTETDLYQQASP